jgi:excisionase family DNA binding protein
MKEERVMSAEVCTTQQAATLLGISVTSVQQLVESGEIEAWKTKGGHRRIPLSAVHAFKSSSHGEVHHIAASGKDERLAVMVVEDNPLQRGIYEAQFASWNLPMRAHMCDNGYKALIDIAKDKPDVMLLDIVMHGIDGYEVMQTVLSYPELADIHIAVVTSLEPADLEARGGLPAGVTYFSKPIVYDELRGYLRACHAQKLKGMQAQAHGI